MDVLKEPALLVGEINDDIDLSLPPTSGEEYIKRVVIEAKKCDNVVVAEIDETRLKKPTITVNPFAGCIEAPISMRPTLEWQECQLVDFANVRLKIAGLRSQMQNENCPRKRSEVTLPYAEDQSGWINFCSGAGEESSPTLGIIFSMNHPTVEQVLEHLVQDIETEGKIRPNFGQWIYALLTVLELPLNPDACSCLRTLARTCSVIRANTASMQDHEINTLNLYICLVARYFRQLDLADQ